MKVFRSFRNTLGLNLALMALLPLLIFGLGSLYYIEQSRIEEIKEKYLFLSSEAAMDVTVFLENEIQSLRAIAKMHEKGLETIQIVNTLYDFQVDDTYGFEAILILNHDKKVEHVLSSKRHDGEANNPLGFDLSRNSLFKDHIPLNSLRFSGVHLSPLTGQLTVSLVLATQNGYLFSNMSLERVYEIISRFAKDRYSEFAILDSNGVLIAHTDKNLIGQRISFHTRPEVIHGLKMEEGLWSDTQSELNALEGVVPIPVANWISWVSVDLEQALMVNDSVRNAMYLLMGAVLFFAGIIALYFGRMFYQPLTQLNLYAKKIGVGEYDDLTVDFKFDEFSDLAASFSDMALVLKEREARLQVEMTRFRNVMQASPLGMILIECHSDGSKVLQEVNPSVEAIFGTEIESKIGYDIFTVLPGLSASDFPDYLNQVSMNYEVWEPRELMLAGEKGQLLLDVLAFKTEENIVACTFQDISERRIREKEDQVRNAGDALLAEISSSLSEADYGGGDVYTLCHEAIGRLATFIGAERSHLFIPNENGTVLSCVANWCEDGTPASTVEGDTVPIEDFPWFVGKFNDSDIISYSSLDQLPAGAGHDKTLLKLGLVKSMIVVPLLLSGENHGALTLETVSFERDWSGADSSLVIRAGGAIIRAMERESYSLSLQQRENQYRSLNLEFQTILHGIGADISLWTADRNLLWSNKTGSDSSDERFIHCFEEGEQDENCEDCAMDKCFRQLKPHEQLVRRDGKLWGVKFFPIQESASEQSRVICMASNVTEKIQLREAAERSSRLASLGQIAAGVAHEINNPNALILMNASIIKDVMRTIKPMLDDRCENEGDFKLGKLSYSRLRDRLSTMIEDLETSAQRIRAIVNDMKGYISRGEMLQDDNLDLNEIVLTALQLVVNTTNTPKSAVRFERHEDLPKISGNFQRLEQVVINLVVNAIQSLPKRDGMVFVKTALNQADGTVSIIIRDEGMGIPEEQLAQITDPFFTTKREGGGTGLGLSVSADIVKDHGGVLLFDSVVAKGTTATVRLPYNK